MLENISNTKTATRRQEKKRHKIFNRILNLRAPRQNVILGNPVHKTDKNKHTLLVQNNT